MHLWLESVIEFLFVTENIHKFGASCDQECFTYSWYLGEKGGGDACPPIIMTEVEVIPFLSFPSYSWFELND